MSLPEGKDFMGFFLLVQFLVGGFNHLEKYEFVSWDDEIPIYDGK